MSLQAVRKLHGGPIDVESGFRLLLALGRVLLKLSTVAHVVALLLSEESSCAFSASFREANILDCYEDILTTLQEFLLDFVLVRF